MSEKKSRFQKYVIKILILENVLNFVLNFGNFFGKIFNLRTALLVFGEQGQLC